MASQASGFTVTRRKNRDWLEEANLAARRDFGRGAVWPTNDEEWVKLLAREMRQWRAKGFGEGRRFKR